MINVWVHLAHYKVLVVAIDGTPQAQERCKNKESRRAPPLPANRQRSHECLKSHSD